jgi:hypothetical protein
VAHQLLNLVPALDASRVTGVVPNLPLLAELIPSEEFGRGRYPCQATVSRMTGGVT